MLGFMGNVVEGEHLPHSKHDKISINSKGNHNAKRICYTDEHTLVLLFVSTLSMCGGSVRNLQEGSLTGTDGDWLRVHWNGP